MQRQKYKTRKSNVPVEKSIVHIIKFTSSLLYAYYVYANGYIFTNIL